MPYLVLSLAALVIGPLVAVGARRVRATSIAVDAFVLVALGGLVLLHILPHAIEGVGFWALLVAAIAFVVTGLAERGLHAGAHSASGPRWPLLGLALIGLFLHAVVDGVGLTGADLHAHAGHDHAHDEAVVDAGALWAIAVLIHRVPFAVSLWWIVWPLFGARIAMLVIGVLAGGTIAGWFAGQELLAVAPSTVVALFEGLLAGTLMHVVLHADLPPAPRGAPRLEQWSATLLGLVAGAVVVYAAGLGHEHTSVVGVGAAFLDLALASAPALLLAYLAVGAMQAFMPADLLRRGQSGRPLGDAIRGVLIGMPLPVCSCGVVPIYRDLVRRGSSPAAGIAFLIATPEIEIAAILLTWELLGGGFAIARVLAAGILAIAVAMLVARVARAPDEAPASSVDRCGVESPAPGLRARLEAMIRHGFGEALDGTAAWILVGLGLAAWMVPNLDPAWLTGLPGALDVPLAAAIGLPLYVCASGSTPLAAVLVAKALSPGAALAFLLTGPATNVTTFGVVRSLHGTRAALLFAATVGGGAIALGYLVNAVFVDYTLVGVTANHEHGHSPLRYAALVLVALGFLASVLRLGVRGFLAPLFAVPNVGERRPAGGHGHRHDAGHGCCES